MYSEHCRVIVDNKSEFYHSSSHVDCTVRCKTRELKYVEESNNSLYQHSLVLKKKTSALSFIIAHLWGSKSYPPSRAVSQGSKFHVAFSIAVLLALALLLEIAFAVMIRSS